MNYGINISIKNNEITILELYDFDKGLEFIMFIDSFYPSKIRTAILNHHKISKDIFYDILSDLKFDIKYRNIFDFCKRYSLEELLL